MPMTNPMDALPKLEQAIHTGIVSLQRGDIHPEIWVHLDEPNGKTRFTYAILNGRKVAAIAMLVLWRPETLN